MGSAGQKSELPMSRFIPLWLLLGAELRTRCGKTFVGPCRKLSSKAVSALTNLPACFFLT